MQWPEAWQMNLNVNSRKVMHFGVKNIKYKIFGKPLLEAEEGKDLEVINSYELDYANHCFVAYDKANNVRSDS